MFVRGIFSGDVIMDKLWIYLSLLSALSLATSDALVKKVLDAKNEYIVAWLRLLFCLPVLSISLFFIKMPVLDATFFIAFVIALPLEILSIILYIKALRLSPLSLTLPFLSLTPVFLIAFSYLILDEPITIQGAMGIVFISSGGYVLNVHTLKKGILEPFRAITREKGSIYMIGVAFIYSFTSSLGKIAVVHSSPLFFGATYFIAVTLLITPLIFRYSRDNPLRLSVVYKLQACITKKIWVVIALAGVAYSFMIISHMFAISIANVAYMIAIKRTSLLIGVAFGYLFFHEKRIGQRLGGAFMMFTGFVLILTSG